MVGWARSHQTNRQPRQRLSVAEKHRRSAILCYIFHDSPRSARFRRVVTSQSPSAFLFIVVFLLSSCSSGVPVSRGYSLVGQHRLHWRRGDASSGRTRARPRGELVGREGARAEERAHHAHHHHGEGENRETAQPSAGRVAARRSVPAAEVPPPSLPDVAFVAPLSVYSYDVHGSETSWNHQRSTRSVQDQSDVVYRELAFAWYGAIEYDGRVSSAARVQVASGEILFLGLLGTC